MTTRKEKHLLPPLQLLVYAYIRLAIDYQDMHLSDLERGNDLKIYHLYLMATF